MSLTPGERLGRYEIQALLGAGSMGEVYRATDTRLGRDVAVKVLPAEFSCDPDRLGRFQREARAASALNHPNIVSMFDVGEHQESPYLVIELLEGETLRERCDRGALELHEVLHIGLQIARGLAAAHEKGIVHRDLKPENVFILTDSRIKILDFGLAKLLDPENGSTGIDGESNAVVTGVGVVLGTVDYMSPEQMRGQPADHRTDLFSFGALLHEMLTGNPPFHRESTTDTFSAILEAEPPTLAKCGVKAPGSVQKLIRQCLEKKVEARIQSANALLAELEAIVAAPASAVRSGAFGGGRAVVIALSIAALVAIAALAAQVFFRAD